ncbi:MAG: heme ABC exporter ATP-binding protein CcmA [Alphaproteobacteria bacterium]|nr:MAG: heme ABC exporter ATP-binding protein CcmA [Alphaproteobacteria bacterium]
MGPNPTVQTQDGFEARSLACRRAGRLVFEGLDFSLAPGQLLVLTGANGSGKSSLLRLAAGLLSPAGGALLRAGVDLAKDRDSHLADLHFVGHKNALKPTLSAAANLEFWARFLGDAGNVEQGLDAMGLGGLADLPAGELSAGQQRRLGLARLFLRPATLWLLDEPTVGLDQASRTRLADAMRRHLECGGMILAATHEDLGLSGGVLELERFAPRTALEEWL